VFPDEFTGMKALMALLRTPRYTQKLVRETLSSHAADVSGPVESRARARQFRLDPDRAVGELNEEEISRLGWAIVSTASKRQPAVHRPGPSPKPAWVGRVLAAADAGSSATAPANVVFNNPNGWQQGVWYVRGADGTYSVSTDQNPRAAASGEFVSYDGDNDWSIVGNQAPGSGGAGAPPASAGPDAGSAPPTDGSPSSYQATITRDDGTTYTVEVLPPGSQLNVPPNAAVVSNTDGTYLVMYNNDGSSWDPAAGGEGQATGGLGQGTDGGDDGADDLGTAEPDNGGTSDPQGRGG
jgi:hypothetical protein